MFENESSKGIATKELAASKILDVLGFSHVRNEQVVNGELEKVVIPLRKD